jgi:hypothetical protein
VGVRLQAKTWQRALSVARPYLYLLPTFFFLFIFTHYPILKTFYMGLFKWNLATPKKQFVGLANYAQAWSAPVLWEVLRNNVIFAVGTVPLTLTLALALALLINQKIRGLAIHRGVLFCPAASLGSRGRLAVVGWSPHSAYLFGPESREPERRWSGEKTPIGERELAYQRKRGCQSQLCPGRGSL